MVRSESLKGNALYDYLKFILAIMVVLIHNSAPKFFYPWLRLAVPLFFIMTGYFLFGKISACNGVFSDERKCVGAFVKRNLTLYLFWFTVLLVPTLYFKDFYSHNIFIFLRSLLFESTFMSSWYIMACILAAPLIYFLSRKLSNQVLFIISLFIYVVICLWSAHFYLFDNLPAIQNFANHYVEIFGVPYGSFPVAIFWIVCGKCFADGSFDRILTHLSPSRKAILLVICAALLYLEWRVSCKFSNSVTSDCYFFLAPVSILIFRYISDIHIAPTSRSLYLRHSSTIIYALHGTVLHGGGYLLAQRLSELTSARFGIIVGFIFTLLICFVVCFLIQRLEKVKGLGWLRYAH